MNLIYALAMIFGTTFIHAAFSAGLLTWRRSLTGEHWMMRGSVGRSSALAAIVFLMALVAYFESFLWAVLYLMVDALPAFADAIYFSIVTFTTLGYGDITLHERWRVLAAIEAANGIILFGWSTALIIAFVQHIFADSTAVDIDS